MVNQVSSLLRRSVDHLAEEVPDSYRLLLETLGPLVVELQVDDERFWLKGGRRIEVCDGAPGTPGARISASRDAVLAVLDAAVSLEQAVEAGMVEVRGALDEILRAHDTLLAYVHAAVRAPSQPGLLTALRGGPP